MLGETLNWRLALATAASVVALMMSACSGGTGFSTGSLLPGSTPKVVDPANERALQVAATSARASQCGYNFDASRLKANYFAYETAQGGTADQIAKLDKTYEYTKGSIGKKMADPEEYCSDEQTASIKADLTRYLAGDYSAATRRAEASLLDRATRGGNQPWDKEKTFCPNQSCY